MSIQIVFRHCEVDVWSSHGDNVARVSALTDTVNKVKKMGIKAANGYLAFMARTIENAIINCRSPFVETYLEDDLYIFFLDEVAQLRHLQLTIDNSRHCDCSSAMAVTNKYLYGTHGADTFLRVIGLRSSEKWAQSWRSALLIKDIVRTD